MSNTSICRIPTSWMIRALERTEYRTARTAVLYVGLQVTRDWTLTGYRGNVLAQHLVSWLLKNDRLKWVNGSCVRYFVGGHNTCSSPMLVQGFSKHLSSNKFVRFRRSESEYSKNFVLTMQTATKKSLKSQSMWCELHWVTSRLAALCLSHSKTSRILKSTTDKRYSNVDDNETIHRETTPPFSMDIPTPCLEWVRRSINYFQGATICGFYPLTKRSLFAQKSIQ